MNMKRRDFHDTARRAAKELGGFQQYAASLLAQATRLHENVPEREQVIEIIEAARTLAVCAGEKIICALVAYEEALDRENDPAFVR
jgi:hypothetical protein